MESANASAEALRKQITDTEVQLRQLKEQLAQVEADQGVNSLSIKDPVTRWPLSPEEYKRYGRQMIVPSIGIRGQLRLKAAKVLIIGAGGLGCPAAAYIAGGGIGTIGIVDGDTVEVSNLHRQILHSTATRGWKKVDSAIASLQALNPHPKYVAYGTHLTPQNAEEIVKNYDVVLDCTDNPASRYLISDICVLLRKPLISASALRSDGQLIVLNSPPQPPGETGGPCYRCVFPKPPPAASVVSCGDGGILGPVVGVMGVLQAVETIKLLVSEAGGEEREASMLLFSATGNGGSMFRSVRLRARRKGCFSCSEEAQISIDSLSSGSLDYVLFCGLAAPVNVLAPEERIEAKEYEIVRAEKKEHILLDVREKVQFDICNLEGSINVPYSRFEGGKEGNWMPQGLAEETSVYVVCRLGNDSQVVARKLKENGIDDVKDIKGGLKAWMEQVDEQWPEY